MTLSYVDLLDEKRKRKKIKATVTTDHPASSYGIPVIVLPDGGALDLMSWVSLNYKIEKASKKETVLLEKLFGNFNAMCGEIKRR